MELPGIASVHELHVWQLDQQKTIATVHILTEDTSLDTYLEKARHVGECLHAYGIHSFTIQPELARDPPGNTAKALTMDSSQSTGQDVQTTAPEGLTCRIQCQNGGCEQPQCCD